MKKIFSIFICCAALVFAEVPLVSIDGVGTRSAGMGNNFTAIANDYSAVFWNPAGLAFVPIREVSAGIGVSQLSNSTELNGIESDYSKSQFTLTNAGLVRSVPTKQGGFAFAIGYSTPYNLSELSRYSGTDIYIDKGNGEGIAGADTLFYGDTLWYDDVRYYANGSLGMWSAAIGWQVAEGFGFGVTASLLKGKLKSHKSLFSHTRKGAFDNVLDDSREVNYSGLDLRFGGLYRINSIAAIGARLEVPQIIKYKETRRYSDGYYEKVEGKLKSSFRGALGAATTLPFATISIDGQFRAPNPDVDRGDLAYWKLGGGLGLEVPIPKINAMVRCGYSWIEYDMFPYAEYIDDVLQINTDYTEDGIKGVQKISAGATFILSKSFTLDVAYVNTQFKSELKTIDWKSSLLKSYNNHRGAVTFSVRY